MLFSWVLPRQDRGLGTPPTTEPVKLKICLLGEEGVGKTSLVRRFVLSEFTERYLRTTGAVVSKRVAYVPVGNETYAAMLTVWDIIGRLEFAGRYEGAYFGNAAGVLAVFDLTRPDTLEALGGWLGRVRHVVGGVPAIVLANKLDLREHIRVDEDAILSFCERFGTPFLETSARTGENVEEAFEDLTRIILRQALAAHRRTMAAEEPRMELSAPAGRA